MKTGEILHEKVHASPRPPPKISFEDNWMKELCSEIAGGSEDFQQTQLKTKNPNVRTLRPVKSEQPSSSLTQEIDKGVLFGCESTNVSTERPVNSCVPVSVERLDKDKDADENVDADQTRMGRLVKSGQSIGLFTQREEIYIDFRVSGLPHAVVKQAENFRVRELVKKIDSPPHREALQADLQQNNVCNPFSDDSIAMIREMGNVELFEAKQFRKCNAQNAFFIGIKELSVALADISWLKANLIKILACGDWMLSQSRTMSSEKGDRVVLGTAKLRHRKSISWLTTRGRDVSKRISMELTTVSNEIQYIVIRNSKLAGPRRSASQRINWQRKTTPTVHPLRSMRDIGKTGISHSTNQAEMHRSNSDQTSEQQSQV